MVDALVVFSDRADLMWLRLLRRGFRHCFVVVQDGGQWIVCEPYSNLTVLGVLDQNDPAAWFRGQGFTVAATQMVAPVARPFPWAPYTCVEAVKRIIGLRDMAVLTPWQLYKSLTPKPQQEARHGRVVRR